MYKNRNINEYHYQSSEGQNNFASYEDWENTLKSKYPSAEIVREWDTVTGVEGQEHVGFWDETLNSGIVYDLNLVKKENAQTVAPKGFEIEGFKQNMKSYVNNIENFIDYDKDGDLYYVYIPFSALKQDDVQTANKIVRIAELYPRCLSAHADLDKKEIRFIFANSPVIKESRDAKLILEITSKDLMRIRDIVAKSTTITASGPVPNTAKQKQLATNMANSITDKDKAFNRGKAAIEVLGDDSEVAQIFFTRAKELGYPVEQELSAAPKTKVLPGSKLPPEQQHKSNAKSSYRGTSILPCGALNLYTGENKYFNVKQDRDSTIEVWETNGKYKAVITAGSKPIFQIGSVETFVHDQNPSRQLFRGKMVDYIIASSMEELIPIYGKSMMCYVYK